MIASIDQVTHVACFGQKTGGIDISIEGGVKPYEYAWNNGTIKQDLIAITTGEYAVTITDAKGCTQILKTTIDEPVKLLVQENKVKNIDCFGNNIGEISLIVSGGVKPYAYSWNNGDSTKNINNLKAGSYSVKIADANGCVVSYSKTLTEPAKMVPVLSNVVDNLCFGDLKGEVNIDVKGGVTPYSYRWSTGATSQDVINLKSGQYQVEIRDANKCLDSLSAKVKENPLLETSVEVTNISCSGDNTGAINLSVKGGVAPYKYKWSNHTRCKQT